MFCTYLTIYLGDKMPSNYVGSSSVKRVENGYHGTVLSKKWKEIWNQELRENPHLFKTIILTLHDEREEATQEELRFQKENNVVKSDEWINEAYASPNGFFGMDLSGELNPNYGERGTKHFKSIWEEKREQIVENMINERNSPKGKSRMIKAITKKWEERRSDGSYEEFCKTMNKVNKDPEKREKAGSKIKNLWDSNPDYQRKMKNRKPGGRKKIEVIVNGVLYSSLSEAVKITGLPYHKIRKLAGLIK